MPSLTDVFVAVKADTATFDSDLKKKLARINASDSGRHIGRTVGGGLRAGVLGPLKGLSGVVAGAFAAVAVGGFLKESVQGLQDHQKVVAQTAAVIKSTGGAAKASVADISSLSDALEAKTTVDGDVIQSGANMLLTFTKVRNEAGKGNDVFNQATKTLVDMAAATGGDASKAAVQLGKALNDPIRGISALAKVGVTFTDQQKKQIAAMVKAGNVAGAQKVILAELNREFGGSAEASATMSGRFTVAFHALQDGVGGVILPLANAVLPLLTRALQRAGSFIQGPFTDGLHAFTSGVSGADEASSGFIGRLNLLGLGIRSLITAYQDNKTTSGGFIGVLERIGVTARGVADFVTGHVVPAVRGLFDLFAKGDFTGDLDRAFGWSEDAPIVDALFRVRDGAVKVRDYVSKQLVPDLVATFGTIKAGVEQSLPSIDLSGIAATFGAQAKTWAGAIIGGIKEGLDTGDFSGLGETIGKGLLAAVGAAGGLAKKIAVELGDLLGKVDWVGLGITVGKLAVPFVVGFATGILNFDLFGLLKGLAAHWQEILIAIISIALTPTKVVGPVAKLLGRIPFAGKLLEWGLLAFKEFSNKFFKVIRTGIGFVGRAFLDGFREVFPAIGTRFSTFLQDLPLRIGVAALELQARGVAMLRGLRDAIIRGIADAARDTGQQVGELLKPFADAGGWLVRAGGDLLGGLGRGIAARLGAAVSWVGSIRQALTTGFNDSVVWLEAAGGQLLQGLFQGALNALAGVGGWVEQMGARILGAVKAFFGIRSPSTVFAALGLDLIAGLAKGVLDNLTAVLAPAVAALGRVFAGAWEAVKSTALAAVRVVVSTFLGMVGIIIDGAARAFGWVPGIGGKLKSAAAAFSRFRDDVNGALNGVHDKTVNVRVQLGAGRAVVGSGLGTVRIEKDGGILKPFADGSENHIAQIARPGEMRLWAEPETGGEAYIPLASSKRDRSTKILSAVASSFGYGLTEYANGGLSIAPQLRGKAEFDKQLAAFNARTADFARRVGEAVRHLAGGGRVVDFARSQAGKPYVWGAAGPGGYDCSGFVSALVNVAEGRPNPYQRRFTTDSLPAGLFTPGHGNFDIGWLAGNPGHVAATVNGVNMESRGGDGVVVGSGSRGAASSLFTKHGHLRGFADGGLRLPGDPPFDLLSRRGKAFRPGLEEALESVAAHGVTTADSGAWIPPRSTRTFRNRTGEWEPVGPPRAGREQRPISIVVNNAPDRPTPQQIREQLERMAIMHGL